MIQVLLSYQNEVITDYWSMTKPAVGELIDTGTGRWRVTAVTHNVAARWKPRMGEQPPHEVIAHCERADR